MESGPASKRWACAKMRQRLQKKMMDSCCSGDPDTSDYTPIGLFLVLDFQKMK